MRLKLVPALGRGTTGNAVTLPSTDADHTVIDGATQIFHRNYGLNEISFEILEGPWMGGYGRFLVFKGRFPKNRYGDYMNASREVAEVAKQHGLIINVHVDFNHEFINLSFPIIDIETAASKILTRHGFSSGVRLSNNNSMDQQPTLYVRGIMSGPYFAAALQEISRELRVQVQLEFNLGLEK